MQLPQRHRRDVPGPGSSVSEDVFRETIRPAGPFQAIVPRPAWTGTGSIPLHDGAGAEQHKDHRAGRDSAAMEKNPPATTQASNTGVDFAGLLMSACQPLFVQWQLPITAGCPPTTRKTGETAPSLREANLREIQGTLGETPKPGNQL